MRIFITYGDIGYEAAKNKIVNEAGATGEFDEIIAYGLENLSTELINSDVFKVKRGGGLWSWKPDVILKTMNSHNDGDVIVYCDAGCSLYASSEWNKFWKILQTHDIIAQRIYQKTEHWTRSELIDAFATDSPNWLKCYQYLATVVIVKVSPFTRAFIQEWRDTVINHPEYVTDVAPDKLSFQHKGFIENRHDQSVFSSLVYKYLCDNINKNKMFVGWEHIEDLDPFFKQAIRATRLRHGEEETTRLKVKAIVKRIIKDYCLKPFYYGPMQWWYSRR